LLRRPDIHVALLALSIIFFIATSLLFWSFTADDAFIVARYAVNARDIGEWVFNAGERVSAMTSPLHGIVMVALAYVATDPIPLYKVMAVVLTVATLTLCSVNYGVNRREALPLVAVVVGPGLVLWTFAGLETPLLAAIVTSMTTVFLNQRPGERRVLIMMAVLAGLTVLTRYDAVLFAGPVLLATLVQTDCARRVKLKAVAVAGAPVALWFLYSWRQFGAILPTSFYLKTPSWALDVVAFNVSYIVEHLAISGVAGMALYVAVRLLASGRAAITLMREAGARWGLHLGLVAILAYGASMATVHMMFAFRHFVPYLPATTLALAHLARRASEPTGDVTWRRSGRWLEPFVASAILAVHVLQAGALYHRSLQGLGTQGEYAAESVAGYSRDFIPAMRRNAQDIKAHWAQLNMGRQPRIWTFAAGALPYHYPEAYIFEQLVSFRYGCLTAGGKRVEARSWKAHADYIHAFTRHGLLPYLLAPVHAGNVKVISARRLNFNHKDEFLVVYYHPRPLPNLLSSRIDQPCLVPSAAGSP
jgi:hypothetical protein